MSRRAEILLIVLLAAYLAAEACRNAAGFPGLHGDEAWLGLYALDIQERGVFSPHEMNTYTGPIYGWLVAQALRLWEPGVLGLRLTGLVLNLLAAFLMSRHLGRCCGRRSALAWLALLCSSALFVMKSRVAWEVYALQNFLLSVIVVLAERLIAREDDSVPVVLAFLAANFCGVLNHFIFISVPLSLFIAAFLNLLFLRDFKRLPFLRLAAVNLFMAAAVYFVKPAISDELWRGHRALLGGAALLWTPLCAALYRLGAGLSAGRLGVFFAADGPIQERLRRALAAALALGLALFFVYHWTALMQIWSGVAVFQRLSSWTPPLAVALPLYAFAAALLGIYFHHALRRLPPAPETHWPPYERFLVHWPLVYAAIFILFRNTNSIRYYVIPSFLLTMALAYILPRTAALRRARFLAPLLAAAVFLNVCFWRETGGPSQRRPIRFYVGWHLEKSMDFADNGALVQAAREQRVCNFPRHDSFTDLPLAFLFRGRPWDCDQSRSFLTRHCWECDRPPFIRWELGRDD